MDHLKERNESIETIPEKEQMTDFLGNYFKTIGLRIIRELKQDVDKVKKISMNKMEISLMR